MARGPEITNEMQHLVGVAMSRQYRRLSLDDRCEIARLQAKGR